MSNHTQGPWKFRLNTNGSFDLAGEDGQKVILCNGRLINQEANLRLIAAAPALLEALKDCEARLALMVGSGCSKMLDAVAAEKARSTIAQATGEPA